MTRMLRRPPPSPRTNGSAPAAPRAEGHAVVLGVDPGSRVTGYAVVALTPHRPLPELVDFGSIRTGAGESHALRLRVIFESLAGVVERHRPGEAAVENIFHAANARSALVLGQARGAALAALSVNGVSVFEYMPLQVKKTVTGSGRADKRQVQRMAALLVRGGEALRDSEAGLDASDALAAALCHLAQRRGLPAAAEAR